jgi:hypothetical protein
MEIASLREGTVPRMVCLRGDAGKGNRLWVIQQTTSIANITTPRIMTDTRTRRCCRSHLPAPLGMVGNDRHPAYTDVVDFITLNRKSPSNQVTGSRRLPNQVDLHLYKSATLRKHASYYMPAVKTQEQDSPTSHRRHHLETCL